MEFNKDKDDARRAMDIAEKKLSKNDYVGAKRFVNMAQSLYPELEGLEQVSTMIHIYSTAEKKISTGESDWYGVLGVDPLADEETVKRQYKKLALLLHPDKNKRKGAEEAFKLVSETWCLLSDKAKRVDYDQERKSKQKPQPNPNKSSASTKFKHAPARSSQKNVGMFWTSCNKCKTQCELSYIRLNKVVPCANCGQCFTAAAKTLWASVVIQEEEKEEKKSAQNKNKKAASYGSWTNCSSSSSAQKTQQESAKSQEATNKTINGASSQQWSNQNQSTSGGTKSSVRFSFSTQRRCSVSVKTSTSGGNTSNQEEERFKRVFEEESQERMILKKQRTSVN